MRVFLIAYGPDDYCIEYANALSRHCQVTLAASKRLMERHAGFADSAVDVHLLDWPPQYSPRNFPFLRKLLGLIRAVDPDVVHNLNEAYCWFMPLRLALRDRAIVTTVHDLDYNPGDPIAGRIPRWLVNGGIKLSPAVIVHGEALKAQATRTLGLPARRLHVLPHIALARYRDTAARRGLTRKDDGQLRVLFFGRMHRYKGLSCLLDSMPRVAAAVPNVRFVVAGDGGDIAVHRARIVANPSIELIDRYIADEEVAQLFVDADLVVLPYLQSSQSGVLALAATFGRPAVVSRVGSLAEVVEAGDMGRVVAPGDAVALADAIVELARDHGLRRSMGDKAAFLAETLLSADHVGRSACALYHQLCGFPAPEHKDGAGIESVKARPAASRQKWGQEAAPRTVPAAGLAAKDRVR